MRTRNGTVSGRPRRRVCQAGGAWKFVFQCRRSPSSEGCTSGSSTPSGGFNAGWKRIAGRHRRDRSHLTQTSRAGLLTELPDFDLGLGLSVRPAVTTGGGIQAPSAPLTRDFQPSLDVTQRAGANVLASATVNTDFAETEVDTRRTNLDAVSALLSREADILSRERRHFRVRSRADPDVLPYFSRRIGLIDGTEVPILAGGKVNGRIGKANFGGLAVGTDRQAGVVDDRSFMAVGRMKRDLWRESWVGAIATVGDPLGRAGSWLGGADFTYATSHFRGDKNFLVGVWGLATGRQDLGRDVDLRTGSRSTIRTICGTWD